MIKNFEKQTHELNSEEVRVANHLFRTLKQSRSKFHTNNEIAIFLNNIYGINIAAPRLRKVIHYIRVELCDLGTIIASFKGYKYSDVLEDIEDYQKSLTQRINSQREIWDEIASLLRRKK